MRSVFKQNLALAISLLVILTGQGVAVSRGMDRAVGQMVLCTGTGPVVVYMDEDGHPTKAPHYCTDYALSLLGALAAAQPELPAAPRLSQPAPLPLAENLVARTLPRKPARAPPFLI